MAINTAARDSAGARIECPVAVAVLSVKVNASGVAHPAWIVQICPHHKHVAREGDGGAEPVSKIRLRVWNVAIATAASDTAGALVKGPVAVSILSVEVDTSCPIHPSWIVEICRHQQLVAREGDGAGVPATYIRLRVWQMAVDTTARHSAGARIEFPSTTLGMHST